MFIPENTENLSLWAIVNLDKLEMAKKSLFDMKLSSQTVEMCCSHEEICLKL